MNIITEKQPTVTVFMAVYNGEKYIKEAIESILNQTYTDFELLIINDGSTDKTLEIITQFNDGRIRVLHNDSNRGLTFTRNHGVKEAKGKYFAILDSDDVAMQHRLKLQVEFMNANPHIAICGGQAVWIDSNGQKTSNYRVDIGQNLSHLLTLHNIFINSTLLMKTSAIQEVGGYREMAPAEDYDLSFRISLKHQVANLDSVLAAYRIHDNNISTIQTEKLHEAEHRIIAYIHTSLGILINPKLVKVHHHILKFDLRETALNELEKLLIILRDKNNINKQYPVVIFQKFIFDTWFNILREKNEKHIISLYFQSPFFKWSFVTFKQLRKIFKKTILPRRSSTYI